MYKLNESYFWKLFTLCVYQCYTKYYNFSNNKLMSITSIDFHGRQQWKSSRTFVREWNKKDISSPVL
jgi:hypothetical protein